MQGVAGGGGRGGGKEGEGGGVQSLVGKLRSHMTLGQKNQNLHKQKQCCNRFNQDFKSGPQPQQQNP